MKAWSIVRPPLAASVLLAGQMARAIYRDDLPSLDNQDPSGVFGSPEAPPLTIVFLGDSSVTSPGVEPLDASWPRQIAMHLADRFHVTAVSVAVGGSKIGDVRASQIDEALALRPDIAYLSVGSNDALRATPIARFEAAYGDAVDILHANVPAVGLSGIGDLGTIPRLPELARGLARIRARAVDRAIARVALEYPRAVKSNAWDVMEQMFTVDSTMFGADLFHASADGHLAFASVGVHVADRLVEVWQDEQSTRS
ncbi:MAG: GDSL-type esterase/lipase family protein [Actinomycetia bacterium]|nr:GDSL-type esterase/lipase family protein [Actinomycetes bacterium]